MDYMSKVHQFGEGWEREFAKCVTKEQHEQVLSIVAKKSPQELQSAVWKTLFLALPQLVNDPATFVGVLFVCHTALSTITQDGATTIHLTEAELAEILTDVAKNERAAERGMENARLRSSF
jgi:hypothetical protein